MRIFSYASVRESRARRGARRTTPPIAWHERTRCRPATARGILKFIQFELIAYPLCINWVAQFRLLKDTPTASLSRHYFLKSTVFGDSRCRGDISK